MQKHPLTYQASPVNYFNNIKDKYCSVLLDSGFDGCQVDENHRYDIISAEPLQVLTEVDDVFNVCEGTSFKYKSTDVYQALAYMLEQLPHDADECFNGGLMGYLSYDLGSQDYRPEFKSQQIMPKVLVGLYQWALVTDHNKKETALLSWDDNYDLTPWIKCFNKVSLMPSLNLKAVGKVQQKIDEVAYQQTIKKIKRYLKEGDCYQINYAQPFSLSIADDSYAIYLKLREKNNVPFGAYLHFEKFNVLSFSPECFLSLNKRKVKAYPIKGTMPRFNDVAKDEQSKLNLTLSKKDQAENLMIVDLMRNDLGRVCQKGSIKVPKLFEAKSFKYVHHLQSTIEGALKPNETVFSLLKSCFPGGSITGAPKKRAMEIIDKLETKNREIYCGSIFYMTKSKMVSNIAIRTAVHKDNSLSFWAGGGIVNDSDAHSEYKESLDKANVFLKLIER